MNEVTKLLLATDRMSPRQVEDYCKPVNKKGNVVKKRVSRHIEDVTKEVHGQMVTVKRYEQVDPDPTYNHEGFMAEICGASYTRLIEIRAAITVYQEKCVRAMDMVEDYEVESTESDEFFGTTEENKALQKEEYLSETEESYEPLDEIFKELS